MWHRSHAMLLPPLPHVSASDDELKVNSSNKVVRHEWPMVAPGILQRSDQSRCQSVAIIAGHWATGPLGHWVTGQL